MKTTQSTGHTPGPWQTQRSHSGRIIYKETQRDFDTNETRMLAFMVRNEDQFPVEESDANARLIAAAPELLNLLILALPYVEEGEAFNKPDGPRLSVQIRALISKAEGNQ